MTRVRRRRETRSRTCAGLWNRSATWKRCGLRRRPQEARYRPVESPGQPGFSAIKGLGGFVEFATATTSWCIALYLRSAVNKTGEKYNLAAGC